MNSRHALPECTCPPGDPQTDCPVVRFMTAAPEPETRTGEPGGELKCVCGGPGDRDHDCPALNTTIAEAKVAAKVEKAMRHIRSKTIAALGEQPGEPERGPFAPYTPTERAILGMAQDRVEQPEPATLTTTPAAPAVERVEAWLVEVQSAGEWLRDCVVLTEPYRANGMYADGHYRFIPLVRAPTNTGEPSDG